MIELSCNELVFRFPEVHEDAVVRVYFKRTLRIPDDDQEYPLPAGLGDFPLSHVDDFEKAPAQWKAHGGVLLPMWQAEAMWIRFSGGYPMAFKVAAGKINAVTGEPWSDSLIAEPQDYLVTPQQPWLDGFCVGDDLIRQFVAMPLGQGDTAEEQITGAAEFGGLQIIAYPMRAGLYESIQRAKEAERLRVRQEMGVTEDSGIRFSRASVDMGMTAGGLMRQQIEADEYGFDAWDHSVYSRCFVHLANAVSYTEITGDQPPEPPPSRHDYEQAGMPWFDHYRADANALEGSKRLSLLDSLAARFRKKGKRLPDNEPVTIGKTIQLADKRKNVRDDW